MQDIYISIGQNIRRRRKEKHLTQESLAANVETSAQYISRIERGQVCPSLEFLYRLSAALECPIYSLLPSTAPSASTCFFSQELASQLNSCTPQQQQFLIQDIQNGDREQALALLEKFSPLLKKYAFFLQSEDALQDFQCFLLAFAKNLQLNELTISTDGAIISYINKAIYHHYIALSKAKRHQLPTVSIESQTDYDPLQFDTAFSESDTYNNLLLLDLKRALSTEEYHVIYDHYFRQYSIQEIATRDNKSRQAINKCKKTAIIKLRRYFGVTS